jgi:hypothetical protein
MKDKKNLNLKKRSRWRAIMKKDSKTIPVMKVHAQKHVTPAKSGSKVKYSVTELQLGKHKV